MPSQFIKVKEPRMMMMMMGTTPREAFIADSMKKVDLSKCDTDSNYSTSTGDICRICHCEADTENPLLSPCYCAGSLKYVHQNCLRQWLAASDTRSCELCKFNFILHTKIKPLSEWRILEMSSVERRRLLCAILFHFVAAVCVVWSLFVLIDRAAEEVQKGLIAWPFWTKLVVVAVGFTGGAVFMYIQCRQYLHLFSRWKAHNRVILVQNAPEKIHQLSQSPTYTCTTKSIHCVPPDNGGTIAYPSSPPQQQLPMAAEEVLYRFENECKKKPIQADVHVEDLCNEEESTSHVVDSYLKALDIESPKLGGYNNQKTDCRSSTTYKSLPNLLSASNEHLLV